jgi:hypothetical protein
MANPTVHIGGGDDSKVTLECRDCNNVNFEICIEPNYTEVPKATVKANFEVTSRQVKFCPFCGGECLDET